MDTGPVSDCTGGISLGVSVCKPDRQGADRPQTELAGRVEKNDNISMRKDNIQQHPVDKTFVKSVDRN